MRRAGFSSTRTRAGWRFPGGGNSRERGARSVDVDLRSDRNVVVQPLDVVIVQPHAPVRHRASDGFGVWRPVDLVAIAEVEAEVSELTLDLRLFGVGGRHEDG